MNDGKSEFDSSYSWEVRKEIWRLWARGESLIRTEIELGKFEEDAPIYRTTIKKERDKLKYIPREVAINLIKEEPEIRSKLESLRPDLKEFLDEAINVPHSQKAESVEQVQTQDVIQDPLIEEARKKHNKDMLDILEEWENGLRNINPQVSAIWKELSGRGFYKDKFFHLTSTNMNNEQKILAHFFIEEQRLFTALIVHLHGDNLWQYWHDYKSMLCREMNIVMQMTGGDEQRRAVLELHYKTNSTKCIDRLEELRIRGVVVSREKLCRYCPEATFTESH